MKKSFNYIPIVFGLLIFLIILHKSMELEPIQTIKPTIPKVEQKAFSYLSMVEMYIFLKGASPKNIMDYLKGEVETLELPLD